MISGGGIADLRRRPAAYQPYRVATQRTLAYPALSPGKSRRGRTLVRYRTRRTGRAWLAPHHRERQNWHHAEKDDISRAKTKAVPAKQHDIDTILAQFIRAQLILAALTGVVFSIVLTVMRVPYGYVMGIIAGFLEFIPIVVPLAAAVPIVGGHWGWLTGT